ncbi:MAG: glycosyltransferase [Zetaproteobacteria bacterium]|nr:MAG: glycosyltransferase [Zetaproteobacteria bacterium]
MGRKRRGTGGGRRARKHRQGGAAGRNGGVAAPADVGVDERQRERDYADRLFSRGHYIDALPLYERLAKRNPTDRELLYRRGYCRYAVNALEPAIEAFEELMAIDEHYRDGRRILMASLIDARKLDAMFDWVRRVEADPVVTPDERAFIFLAHLIVCNWEQAYAMLPEVVALIKAGKICFNQLPGLLFNLLSIQSDGVSNRDIYEISRITARKAHEEFQRFSLPPIDADGEQMRVRGRLKIGYLSADFRSHPVGYFMYSILSEHDRSRFEIYCYSCARQQDENTRQMRRVCDHFIDVVRLNSVEIAGRIRRDGIHLLVDLGGYTTNSQLSALLFRPAPVQVSYLGYPNTTGMDEVDFRISDPYVDTPEGTIYSEELLVMPKSFLCFGMRSRAERRGDAPAERNGYVTFGSFNAVRKYTPQVIAVWSRILRAVPGSRLLIKAFWMDAMVRENIMREFARHGIGEERIENLPFAEDYDAHMACYNRVDIALDTFPYSGTTTTCEALWMGVPVVTLVGSAHQQRVSYSILKNVGFEETICHSEEEYVATAVRLAGNPAGLSALRPMLHTLFAYSPVAQPASMVPDLEELYLEGCRRKGVDLSGMYGKEMQASMAGVAIVVPRHLRRSLVGFVLAEQGDWFEEEIRFLRRALPEGGRVVDLHAGYGCYALSSAAVVGSRGRVAAVEEDEARRRMLMRSAEENGFSHLQVVGGIDGALEAVPPQEVDCIALHRGVPSELERILPWLEGGDPLVFAAWPEEEEERRRTVDFFGRLGLAPWVLVPGLHLLAPLTAEEACGSAENRLFFCRGDGRGRRLEQAGWLVREERAQVRLPEGAVLWRPVLEERGYAAGWVARWLESTPPSHPLSHILNAYVMAHQPDRPPAERLGLLNAAVGMLMELEGVTDDPWLLVTCARLARERGMASLALDCLQRLEALLIGKIELQAVRPFLPAAPEYERERVEEGGPLRAWLERQAIVEQELIRHPTGWMDGRSALEAAKRLRDRGLSDARLSRREELVLQRAPELLGSDEALQGEEEGPFAGLPGAREDRGIVVIEELDERARGLLRGFLSADDAPEWLVVVIPNGPRQKEIADYCNDVPVYPHRKLCVITVHDDYLESFTCRQLAERCACFYRHDPDRLAEQLMHQAAIDHGLSVHSSEVLLRAAGGGRGGAGRSQGAKRRAGHPAAEASEVRREERGLVVVDRLVPGIWRMLFAWLTRGEGMPSHVTMLVPVIEQQAQIVQYLQQMLQYDRQAEGLSVRITGMKEAGMERACLNEALAAHGSLHLPAGSGSPIQEMARALAEWRGNVRIVRHEEQPDYEPEPLPPVEDFRVTVVIFTYNRVDLLRRAVESVLRQTYDDFVLRIFDDASSDGTEDYCRALAARDGRVDYRRNERNLGLGGNVRRGAASVDSDLFLMLSDDDYLLDPTAIQRMVERFSDDPSLGMVFGQCEIGDLNGERLFSRIPGNLTQDCLLDVRQTMLDSVFGNHIFGGGNIYRRAALERMARYASRYWRRMDWIDALISEGDYLCNLLMVMTCRTGYVHLPSVHYSAGGETFSSSQLGGGWSVEIRLRTAALLDDMYIRAFGRDASLDGRMERMFAIFDEKLRQIERGLSQEERALHAGKLREFRAMLRAMRARTLPEAIRAGGLG